VWWAASTIHKPHGLANSKIGQPGLNTVS
jgi:hypothetical protein